MNKKINKCHVKESGSSVQVGNNSMSVSEGHLGEI